MITTKQVRFSIAILAGMPGTGYSGGRYHAWIMAEALAAQGHTVTFIFVGKQIPEFCGNFAYLKTHQRISHILLDSDQYLDTRGVTFDFVYAVHDMDSSLLFYLNCISLARHSGAHLIALNFETPNWFNALSPTPRREDQWDGLVLMSQYASLVQSSTAESTRYARDFLPLTPAETRFDHACPAINDTAVRLATGTPKQNEIVLFVRKLQDSHKGSAQIGQLFCEALRGYTVTLIGSPMVREALLPLLLQQAEPYGITLSFLENVTDAEKFHAITRAKALVFPSFFEGFGYPPVEALACGTRCVAFDLPVLRETCGDALDLVPVGDWQALRDRLCTVIRDVPEAPSDPIPFPVQDQITITGFGQRLTELLVSCQQQPRPQALVELDEGPLFVALSRVYKGFVETLRKYATHINTSS